jgi:cytochrome P450
MAFMESDVSHHSKGLLDPDVQQCPFPFYAELRTGDPVRYMPELGVYFVANYEIGRKILIDSKHFAKKSAQSDGRRYIEPDPAATELLRTKDVGLPIAMITHKEGAEHRAVRGIVDRHFQGGMIRKMEDHIVSIGTELLDRIKGQTAVEAVSAFAVPMPVYVISDMLGIPKSEYLRSKKWSDGVVTYLAMRVPTEQAIAGAEAMIEMHRYMVEQVRARRAEPRDDLLSVVAQAQYQGRPLTDHELCGMTDELLVGGNETTTSAIGSGLLHLARHSELQAKLRAGPTLIPKFVEEVLRTAAPLQVTLRLALSDVMIGGVNIPAGSQIFVGIGSANRDECKFARADEIDPERPNGPPHITFGAGEHHCLGAELARLELRVAFRLWLERYASIELAQDPDSIEYPASYTIRGPLALELRLQAA